MNDTVYKHFRLDEMEYQFNPRVSVTNYQEFVATRAQASGAARARMKSFCNVPYGDSPGSVLDIFPAEQEESPVQLYIHGGYWRGGSKNDYSFIAQPFVDAGVTMVLLEYDLCPSVTIGDIVHQARSGIAWCYQNISRYGGNPEQLYISGSSAGGHLVTMALNHDWERAGLPPDLVKGAVAITGVYDLDPVFHVSVNEDIRLTPEQARDFSPMVYPPHNHTPLVIAVGASETPGWIQMSRDFFTLCSQRGIECGYLEVPGTHHFSISAQLGEPSSVMTKTVLEQMGVASPTETTTPSLRP